VIDKVNESGGANQFASGRRKPPVRLSRAMLVKNSYLDGEQGFPLVQEPVTEDVNLVEWARGQVNEIERDLLAHGAILFRGFGVDTISCFEQFARAISPDLLDYFERARNSQPFVVHQFAQGLAFDQLHDYVRLSVGRLSIVMNRRNVRM